VINERKAKRLEIHKLQSSNLCEPDTASISEELKHPRDLVDILLDATGMLSSFRGVDTGYVGASVL